jgi:hypothetical protein
MKSIHEKMQKYFLFALKINCLIALSKEDKLCTY